MFETASIMGTLEIMIDLMTREGTPICNSQAPAPNEINKNKFRMLLDSHANWLLRKEPCGYYNCFGLVWASRRTAVYEQEQVELILNEDGYRRLKSDEQPRSGDLAVYYFNDNSIIHVGMITELKYIVGSSTSSTDSEKFPWLLSKWNDSGGEVLHHYQDVPWPEGEYRIIFWTERGSN